LGVLAALLVVAGLTSPLTAQEPETPETPETPERKGTYYDNFGRGQGQGHGHGHGHGQVEGQGHGHGHGHGHGGGHGHGRRGAAAPPPQPIDLETAPRISWTNPEGGSWSEPGNWSGGAVPGKSDHAIIDLPGTYTVVVDIEARVGAVSVGSESGTQTVAIPREALAFASPMTLGPSAVLQLNGGRITGGGDLIVQGAVDWSGGSMSGRGTARIAPEGRLAILGDQRKVLSLRNIENAGTMVWSGAGNLVVTFDAKIVNQEGARFEISSGALLDVYGPPGPAVQNAGTLRVVSGLKPTFETPLDNTGTLDLEGGGLHLLDAYTGDGEVLGRGNLEQGPAGSAAASDG
jgi:hypothetical protein